MRAGATGALSAASAPSRHGLVRAALRDTGRRVDAASASRQSASVSIASSFAVASRSAHARASMPDQRSPTSAIRAAMVRSVHVRGPTAPPSTSAHVHGAETGAPGLARTA